MSKLLESKVALVTGAASGIGLEIAREFAKEGAKVVISDLNEKAVQHAAEELTEQGYEVLSAVCDVTNEEQVEKSVSKTLETFGRLDILVNNAGIQHVSDIENFPTDKFEFMLKLMLTAPFSDKKSIPFDEKTKIWPHHQYGFHKWFNRFCRESGLLQRQTRFDRFN